jgi:O-antigen ligase
MISFAYAAVWIFVFVLPWERMTPSEGVSLLSRVTGVVALGAALLAVVISGRIRRWNLFHVAALLFVSWAGITLLFFSTARTIPLGFWTLVQLFLMVWMIWELAPTRRRMIGLLLAYVLGAYVAVLGTLMLYRREAGALRRYSAAGDPNDLAMTLALALPIAWYLGMTYRQPLLRWVCRAYLPLGLLAVAFTASRGGMLVSVVALSIVPLTMTKLSPGRLATAVGVLALSGALAVTYVPDRIMQRLATTGAEVEEGRLGGRLKLWQAGLKAFAQKPVVGYGTSGFKRAIDPWLMQRSQVAHNSYLSVLVEQGMLGFLLFSMMGVAVFMAVLRLPPLERRFALVLFAALATAMLPLTWEDRKAAWFILAALVGFSKAPPAWHAAGERQPFGSRAVPTVRPAMLARRSAAPGVRRADPDDRT